MTAQHSARHLTHPKYRPDIDGLRAVAILAVVGFHAFPTWVRGGFIGVDIFFVISGYLISTIIMGSLERNSFNFIEFYVRRINRIFPSLLLVLIACFAFGWFALLADEYKQLGKHIAGGAGFISNYFFWGESGYFDNAAETKPLLHLWSLGIEEQFYIVWPLLLWFVWKKRLNLLTVTLLIAFISFGLNVAKVNGGHLIDAFYSPQTRFWELLIGSILAYTTLHHQTFFSRTKHQLDVWLGKIIYAHATEANGKTLRNVQSLLGAAFLAIGFLLITREGRFPGWWAVLPTLGTAIIISAGMQAWFNRVVLSHKVLVWFGLISFPLYLWHWPLLSFARIVGGETPSGKIRIAAVLISIALAWMTYRLIEKPIRFGRNKRLQALILSLLMISVGCLGFYGYKKDGMKFRNYLILKNNGDVGHEAFHKYMDQHYFFCTPSNILENTFKWDNLNRCFQSKEKVPVTMAIIGDSQAEHLFIGLADALPRKNVVYYFKDMLPVIGEKKFEDIFKHVIENKLITTVIITARWSVKGVPKPELSKTLATLTAAGKTVYLTDSIPTFWLDVAGCKYQRSFQNAPQCTQVIKSTIDEHDAFYPSLISVMRENPEVKMLNTFYYFCNKDIGICSVAKDAMLLFRDSYHLNINGSKFVGLKLFEQYPNLLN